MRRLFRALERHGVEHLLISGQASVLYGAAPFSEDFDLWVRPTPRAWRRLLAALRDCRARVYKLTPPVEDRYIRRGHGFHFTLEDPKHGLLYLDVMGRPPRVGPFASVRRRARLLESPWGPIPVVAPEDLVRLKLTRRPADYEVISNLARIRVEEGPTKAAYRWALTVSFDVGHLQECLLAAAPRWPDLLRLGRPALRPLAALARRRSRDPVAATERCQRLLAREMAEHQNRDWAYWRPRLRELARLRREGRLLAEGAPVRRP